MGKPELQTPEVEQLDPKQLTLGRAIGNTIAGNVGEHQRSTIGWTGEREVERSKTG